ncbi:Ribose-phosphate pyrophosphokinase [hydrothermal vent metagenome]|uniref:ribose-phosphate diphosphokinase n=1 Tax=hydrothermal vent metagenome TaxID=652676 RepID=A0A3B1D3P7_9ZZZZ
MNNFRLFGLDGSNKYAKRVATYLDTPLSRHTEFFFSDKETYVRSDENVRGCDVYVISSLCTDKKQSAAEKLTKLLFFIGSLVDASARRITVVTPYLAFARQDRKTESRAPISIKYLAQCVEAVGANRVITLDVHNLSALQNAFRIPTDNLEAKNLMVDYLCGITSIIGDKGVAEISDPHIPNPLIENPNDLVVLSPDSGGMGRAKRFRNSLEQRLGLENEIEVAYIDKERVSGNKVQGSKIVGNVTGKRVIILDDMIASGSTIALAADAVKRNQGKVWAACASHGMFVGKPNKNLKGIKRIVITDTISPFRLDPQKYDGRLFVIPTAMMFARAIRRTHEEGGSISDLLK